MSGEITDPGAYKARVREALDVLQNYVGDDGKINATKLTQEIKRLHAENATLLAERDALQAEVDELKVVAKCASEQQDSLFSEARTLNERADKLEEALRLIESAKDRGFGIDYARGVAQSALGSRACRVDGEGE